MKLNKKITWINIIYGVLLITVGTLAFVFAIIDPTKVRAVVSYSIAACLFVLGLIIIIDSVVRTTHEKFSSALVVGSIVIALGTILCVNTSFITSFFILFLSIFLIALGTLVFVKMILFIVYKEKLSLIIAFGIAAALVITLGSLGIVHMDGAEKIIFGTLGVALVVFGVIQIVFGINYLSKNKSNVKDAEMREITPKVIENKKK